MSELKIPCITGFESEQDKKKKQTALAKIDSIIQRTDFNTDYKLAIIKQIIYEVENN